MARYASKALVKDLQKLIQEITGFNPEEENYKRCEQYALSTFFNHTFLETNHMDVQRNMDMWIEKFELNSEIQKSKKLRELNTKLVNHEAFKDSKEEIQWKVLRLLILFAGHGKKDSCTVPLEEVFTESVETPFDWHAHLLEGIEIDPAIGQQSSDESVWSSSEDESEIIQTEIKDAVDDDHLLDIVEALEELNVGSRDTGDLIPPLDVNSWREEINDSWRGDEEGYQHPAPPCTFPAARLIDIWSRHFGEKTPRVLSEYVIIREILWVLRDPSACGLVFKKDGDEFYVAKDLSVCSLSPGSLHASLNSLCPYLAMLDEIQTFVKELMPSSEQSLYPPLTYKAYACGLNIVFSIQNQYLHDLERKVMAQDDINTLISIMEDLKPWLKFLHNLSSVHKAAILDWKTHDAWICATRLLSSIGSAMNHASSSEFTAVLLSLLMRSLKPYMDIMEKWLKSGTLSDNQSEFIIYREIVCSEDTLWKGDYKSRPYGKVLAESKVCALPLFEPLVTQGLVAGRSLQLVQGLNCMGDIPCPSSDESLHSELVSWVRSQLLPPVVLGGVTRDSIFHKSDHSILQIDDQLQDPLAADLGLDQETGSDTSSISDMLPAMDQCMKDYLLSTTDPYLLKAFDDILDFGLDKTYQEHFDPPKVQLLFKSSEVSVFQPMGPLLQRGLTLLISKRVLSVGQVARTLLKDKCKLGFHLEAMRGVALLGFGDAMHQFLSNIIDQINKQNDWRRWSTWYFMSNQLQSCLSLHHLDWSHLFTVEVLQKVAVDKTSEITEGFPLMQFLNHLTLHYSEEWPITLVLQEENMSIYNKVFRFLSKLKCALISLQRLSFANLVAASDEHKVEIVRTLQVLRSWLLFLLGSLQTHLLGHILTTLKEQLDKALAETKDLHAALQAQEQFLKRVHSYCLMDSSNSLAAHNIIMEVVALAMTTCEAWVDPDLNLEQVQGLLEDYRKNHSFLAIVFGTLTRFGENSHLAGVAAALNHNLEP